MAALRGFAESCGKILPRVTGTRAAALALPLLREHLLGGGVRADHDPVLDPLFHEGKEAPDTLLLVDCVPDDGKLPLSLSSQEEAAYSLRSCSEAEVSCMTRGRKS